LAFDKAAIGTHELCLGFGVVVFYSFFLSFYVAYGFVYFV
jgi:hypothetical protein